MLSSFVTSALLLVGCVFVRGDTSTGRCGTQGGNLNCGSFGTVNKCCSQHGWCGDTNGHCGTGCQTGFGICSGPTTTPTPPVPTIGPRPKVGNVVYGRGIEDCDKPGSIALTYDDGPWQYTAQLLDILAQKGVKATFFVTGNNLDKGAIDSVTQWRQVIQRAYNEGHQIASHTWDHLDLSTISEADRRFQMIRNEQALLSILGRYPTYMRPPFISCNAACEATMGALGYHVIIWDFDTDDYNNASPQLIQNSKNRIIQQLKSPAATTDWLSIAHDIHQQTVINLTSFQIDADIKAGYKHVLLGECLNDPEANWYRTTL